MYNSLFFPKPSVTSTGAVAGQQITVSGTAKQFSALNSITDFVMFDIQDADVWVTIDGTTPSATNGHVLYQGRAYTWSRAMATAAKFVRTGSTDAVIHCSELQC